MHHQQAARRQRADIIDNAMLSPSVAIPARSGAMGDCARSRSRSRRRSAEGNPSETTAGEGDRHQTTQGERDRCETTEGDTTAKPSTQSSARATMGSRIRPYTTAVSAWHFSVTGPLRRAWLRPPYAGPRASPGPLTQHGGRGAAPRRDTQGSPAVSEQVRRLFEPASHGSD